VKNQEENHVEAVFDFFQGLAGKEPDIQLVSMEGSILQTHKFILTLYSPVLKNVLGTSSVAPSFISVPCSKTTLQTLLSILTTGISTSDNKQVWFDVVDAAEVLGIVLTNIQFEEEDINDTKKNVQMEKKKKKSKKKSETVNVKVNENLLTVNTSEAKNESLRDDFVNSLEEIPNLSLDYKRLDSSNGLETESLNGKQCEKKQLLKCEECGKSFAKRYRLKRHAVVHSVMKAFSCDVCESKFSRKDKLDNHINAKHTEISDKICYECHICNKSYGTNWYLNKHLEKEHPIKSDTTFM